MKKRNIESILIPGMSGSFGLLLSAAWVCLAVTSVPTLADEGEERSRVARYSIGASFGSRGLGATFGSVTDWSFTEGDQIQWRLLASGIDRNTDDEVDIAGIDYLDSDSSIYAIQGGIDWYPAQDGWARQVYFSGGLIYENGDFSGMADLSRTIVVGNVEVSPGDIESLQTRIENSQVLPYASIGWGNRIGADRGFSLFAEVGVAVAFSEARVSILVADPAGLLTDNDVASEAKNIRDDLLGAAVFGTVGVAYHF